MATNTVETTSGKTPKWDQDTSGNRATIPFDLPGRVAVDPYREALEAWSGVSRRRRQGR